MQQTIAMLQSSFIGGRRKHMQARHPSLGGEAIIQSRAKIPMVHGSTMANSFRHEDEKQSIGRGRTCRLAEDAVALPRPRSRDQALLDQGMQGLGQGARAHARFHSQHPQSRQALLPAPTSHAPAQPRRSHFNLAAKPAARAGIHGRFHLSMLARGKPTSKGFPAPLPILSQNYDKIHPNLGLSKLPGFGDKQSAHRSVRPPHHRDPFRPLLPPIFPPPSPTPSRHPHPHLSQNRDSNRTVSAPPWHVSGMWGYSGSSLVFHNHCRTVQHQPPVRP